MARKKKTRRISDIMPVRKTDKKPEMPKARAGKKPTRYELDAKAREEKKKRKHKGLPSGSRHSLQENNQNTQSAVKKDPRIGSRKKVPLIVEFVNKPKKDGFIESAHTIREISRPDPAAELERLENNEILNELLDQLEAGKKLGREDQRFVDECLERIEELMNELGLGDDPENEDDLYRTFEKIDINRFR